MALTERDVPYEFLVRWGRDSKVQGCHVVWATIIERDGVFVSQTSGLAMPVSDSQLPATSGTVEPFPLSDVLTQLQIDALGELDQFKSLCTEQKGEIGRLTNKVSRLEAQSR